MYNEKRVKMFFFKKKEKISEYKIRKEKSDDELGCDYRCIYC